jgi:hypothetical protein
MNAITRFEIARRVLRHDIVVPLERTESLLPTSADDIFNMTATDYAQAVVKYAFAFREQEEQTEWNTAAGVSIPTVDIISPRVSISHETCTGNTVLRVQRATSVWVGLKLVLHRPNAPLDLTRERDAFLALLAEGTYPESRVWRQWEAAAEVAKAIDFPDVDWVVAKASKQRNTALMVWAQAREAHQRAMSQRQLN